MQHFNLNNSKLLEFFKALSNHKTILAVVLIAVLPMLFLWRVTFLGQILLPVDLLKFTEPWRSETALANGPAQDTNSIWNYLLSDAVWSLYPMAVSAHQAWQTGVPFWNPTEMNGVPGLAGGFLYSSPINLLAFLMPVAQAIGWSAILHLIIAGVSTFALLREMQCGYFGALVGSLAFMFNGYLIGWLSFPHMITMVWLPLVFFGIERAYNQQNWRWLLLAAAAFTMQIITGNILWAVYGGVTVVLLAIYRGLLHWWESKSFKSFLIFPLHSVVALGLGTLLAAPQLLMTVFELYPLSVRNQATPDAFPLVHQLVRIFAPNFWGNPQYNIYVATSNFSTTGLYIGILPIIFAGFSLLSPRRWLALGFVSLGWAAVLAACGIFPFVQIFPLIYPGFHQTDPGRIFYIVTFFWAVAAGLGADWAINSRFNLQSRFLIAALAGLTLTAVSGIFLLIFRVEAFMRFFSEPDYEKLVLLRLSNLAMVAIWVGAATVIFYLWQQEKIHTNVFGAAIVLIIIGDLFVQGINYNPTFPPNMVFPNTASIQQLQHLSQSDDEQVRIVSLYPDKLLPGNTYETYELSSINGYNSWLLRRYSDYATLTQQRGQGWPNQAYFIDCCTPLLNALNVKYVYAPAGVIPSSASPPLQLLSHLSTAHIEAEESHVQQTEWAINGISRPVLFQHPPAKVEFQGKVFEEQMQLITAIGINPEAWPKPGDGVEFQIFIRGKNNGQPETVFSHYLNPKENVSDQTWVPVQINLSNYYGQDITVSLVTQPGPEQDFAFDWAGWAEPRIIVPSQLELVFDGPNKIYHNKASLPRAWVVHNVIQVPPENMAQVEQALADSSFDPGVTAVIEGQLPNALGTKSETDHVKIAAYGPQRVEIEAKLADPGLLVLSDMIYPGWTVAVDGISQPIYPTNLVMRGVYLEGGTHKVVFSFTPATFTIGAAISLATLLIVLLGIIFHTQINNLYNLFDTSLKLDE